MDNQILTSANKFSSGGHTGISSDICTRFRISTVRRRNLSTRFDNIFVKNNHLRANIDAGIRGITLLILVAVSNTLRLNIMDTVLAITQNSNSIVSNFKHRHRQISLGTGVDIAVVGNISCIHVGKSQSLFFKATTACLCNIDFISLGKINCRTAQIVIPAIRMIVAEQEDDVQSGVACLVQNIKDVICMTAVTIVDSTHAVVQG